MNQALKDIPDRILNLAMGALTQANTHAVYSDPGNEHWEHICVLNTAHAGELFLKAIIAKEHPLLIFKDIFNLDDNRGGLLDIETLIKRGRTHDFERLPQILWATTDKRIPNSTCFERLRLARNAIQHFCAPDEQDFRGSCQKDCTDWRREHGGVMRWDASPSQTSQPVPIFPFLTRSDPFGGDVVRAFSAEPAERRGLAFRARD